MARLEYHLNLQIYEHQALKEGLFATMAFR